MDPVRSSNDWKIEFLLEIHDYLKRWEKNKIGVLSRETFFALKQTCLALAECCRYLLTKTEFKFVLLGHLQSDPIESRFGWLRQLSGGNYFISVRQVVEGDAKIKMLSLLKHSDLTIQNIDDFIDDISHQADDGLNENATKMFQCWIVFYPQMTLKEAPYITLPGLSFIAFSIQHVVNI